MVMKMKEKGQYFYGLLFKQISVSFEIAMQREAARYDLTPAQASILMYLEKADHPVNQRELENYFRLSNPTVTGLMKRMEAKGFIRREISQADARSKYILLTPKAQSISKEVGSNMLCMEQRITHNMGKEENRLFQDLLTRALKNICTCREEQETAEENQNEE